jgi:hypothetical protein
MTTSLKARVMVGVHEVHVAVAGAQLAPTASVAACSSSSSCCCRSSKK